MTFKLVNKERPHHLNEYQYDYIVAIEGSEYE